MTASSDHGWFCPLPWFAPILSGESTCALSSSGSAVAYVPSNAPVTLEHMWPREVFSQMRESFLPAVHALRRRRRLAVGPHMTVLFEHPALLWWHIQEMVRIEKGDVSQWHEEYAVYQPLAPRAGWVTATVFLEYPDPDQRRVALLALAGIEQACCLMYTTALGEKKTSDVHIIHTDPYAHQPIRSSMASSPSAKASAVSFWAFPVDNSWKTSSFPNADRQENPGGKCVHWQCTHPAYTHDAEIPSALWQEISSIA